ncbi:MAG: hypothetical protein ACTSSP_10075 [Candidatus Asgardarchaeia archaeon]
MSITVKIDKKINAELEKMIAKLLIEKGIKISKKKALEAAIKFALKNKTSFLKELGIEENKISVEDDIAWKLLNKPKKWGIKDASISIDRVLYGGE